MTSKLNPLLLCITIFSAVVSSEKLRLVCDELETLPEGTPLYEGLYCTVTDFHVNYTTQVDCDVYPLDRQNVKVVKFTNSRMLYVPHGMFRFFTNIREFDISSSQIEALQRNFEGAKNLVFLTISHNNLTELGASLFVDAPTLTVIDFSHNQIGKISRFTFAESRSISRLVFSHNRITELDAQLFNGLRFLDQLFLDNNRIEAIPSGLFAGNKLLQKVVLNNNRISMVGCDHFAGLKYLEALHLAKNNLTHFDPTCLVNKLDSFNINDNNLTRLTIRKMLMVEAANNRISEIVLEDDFSALKILSLSNNSLRNIDNITSLLVNLEVLDVSFNTVGKLNIATFSKLKKLTKLDLEHTRISNLDFGTFASQKELKTLDISYNELNRVNWDTFSPYLTKLEELFVDGNNLTEIEGTGYIIHNFPQLRILGISNNNFNCSYLSTFFRFLNFGKVKLNVDPELSSTMNTTHINGVACNSNHNAVIDASGGTVHHNGVATPQIEFEMLKTKMEYFYLHDVDMVNKIDLLHSKIYEQNQQQERLEATLRNIKLFVIGVALFGFVFVAVQFTRTFMMNRRLINLSSSGGFPSTATMNTLQSNIAF